MSGVFISYASEDRALAEVLAHALEAQGWPVWWDRKIPFGKSFDQVIEDSLDQARCVVVLWTKSSVESRWVRSEASAAAERDVLIPILFEAGVKIPLEFRMLQAVNLVGWQAGEAQVQFDALLRQIAGMLDAAAPAPSTLPSSPTPRPIPSRSRRTLWFAAFIAAPTILLVATIGILAAWRAPTRIQLDAVIERISFTLAGDGAIDVPADALTFRSLAIENFDEARFKPAPGMAKLDASAEVILSGVTGERPVLNLMSLSDAAAGRLQAIRLQPNAKVAIETSAAAPGTFTLRVDGQPFSTNVLPAGAIQLDAAAVSVQGLAGAAVNGNSIALKLALREDSPYVEVHGERRSFVVNATAAATSPVALVVGAPIAAIELLKQNADGSAHSALTAAAEVSYPDHPGQAAARLAATDALALADLREATIASLKLDPAKSSMTLRLDAVAGRIEISSGGERRDFRLTALDRLWHNARVIVLLVDAAWVASVAFGAYKYIQDGRTRR